MKAHNGFDKNMQCRGFQYTEGSIPAVKSVLISIRPKWCELISSGEKTVELRKTRPKLDVPFKCYIYCTAEIAEHDALWILDYPSREKYSIAAVSAYLERAEGASKGNRKVVGEFTCNRIDSLVRIGYTGSGELPRYRILGIDSHIQPAEELFKAACLTESEAENYLKGRYGFGWHISDLHIYDKPRELGEFIGLRTMKKAFEFRLLDRPPQSWCYVQGGGKILEVER